MAPTTHFRTCPLCEAMCGLAVTVEDDGAGFDPGAISIGYGLLGIRERAAAFGGTIDIGSAPGEGTRIEVEIPLESVDE